MHRIRLMEKFASATDLTAEPLPGRPLIEIYGENSVLIEHHQGISEYSDNTVKIAVKFGKISIGGSNLQLLEINKERLIISGKIHCVELMKG